MYGIFQLSLRHETAVIFVLLQPKNDGVIIRNVDKSCYKIRIEATVTTEPDPNVLLLSTKQKQRGAVRIRFEKTGIFLLNSPTSQLTDID